MILPEHEMRGVIKGQALPADIRVGESVPAYLLRKFDEVVAERDRLQEQVKALAGENLMLKSGPQGFFSYGSDCGYEEHDTAEKAIEFAQGEIDDYQGNACDGWPDEVGSVVWGVVMQRATETNKRPVSEEDTHIAEHISYMCDFNLLPVIETPATDAAIREIKAQGVDEFAKHPALRLLSCSHIATEFAAQLRAKPEGEQP